MADNLVSIFARRRAARASTLHVPAGARGQRGSGLLALIFGAALVVGLFMAEHQLIVGELPRLLRGGQPW